MILETALICGFLIGFVITLATWLKFLAFWMSLIWEAGKRSDRYDPSGLSGLAKITVEARYKTGWRGMFRTTIFAALSFCATMFMGLMLIAPEDEECRARFGDIAENFNGRAKCALLLSGVLERKTG